MSEEKKEKKAKDKKPASLVARLTAMPVNAVKSTASAATSAAKSKTGLVMIAVGLLALGAYYALQNNLVAMPDVVRSALVAPAPTKVTIKPVQVAPMAQVAPAPLRVVHVDSMSGRFDSLEAKVEKCIAFFDKYEKRAAAKK